MTGLNALIVAFDDAIRWSEDAESTRVPEADVSAAPGLSDDRSTFAGPGSEEQIAAAEARVLGYRVEDPSEMMLKAEFILREMRKLTDQNEEFDVYADQLRADLALLLESRANRPRMFAG